MKRRQFIKGVVLSILASKTALPEITRAMPDTHVIDGFSQGGIVPGMGSSDHIPALIEPGVTYIPRELYEQLYGT